MPTLTAVDTSKLCKVTNNSGVDIVVGMPLTAAETDNSNPIVSFNKDFEILLASGGGTVIKTSNSDTVTLDRTHINNGKPTYSSYYDLAISSSDWLRPIANISVAQDWDTDTYDPQTVTSDDDEAMKETADFYQTIAAYPNSQLAQDYVNSMTQADSNADSKADSSPDSAQNVGNSIDGDVADFFKNTKSYQHVTQYTIVALKAYYDYFPFVWAQYGSATYYIYSSDGNSTTFAGTLSLQKPDTVDITKVNAGYTCNFNPAVNPSDTTKIDVDPSKAKSLTYSDNTFVDDANSDLPAICLKGVFQLKRTFTKAPADTVIIVVICGSINGITSVGFDQAQATTPDDTTQDWLNSLFHPTTAAGIFNSVMTILGALMMLHFVASTIYGIGKWIKTQISGPTPKPVSQADLQAQRNSINEEIKAKLDAIYEKVSNNKSTLPNDSVGAQKTAATEADNLSDQVSAAQIEDQLVTMNDNLKVLEPYAAQADDGGALNTSVEDMGDSIIKAHGTLTQADPDNLGAAVDEVRPQMPGLTQQMSKLNTDVSAVVDADAKATIKQNQDVMDEVQSEVDDESKVAEDEEADTSSSDPEADGVDFPPE